MFSAEVIIMPLEEKHDPSILGSFVEQGSLSGINGTLSWGKKTTMNKSSFMCIQFCAQKTVIFPRGKCSFCFCFFFGMIMTRKDLDWFQTVFLSKISSVDGLILE